MTVNLDNLAAIFNLAKELSTSDGEVKEEELEILWDFFQTFGEMNSSVLGFIMSTGDKMSFEEACSNIEGLDDGAKQQISNLFAKIVCADGELTEDEEDLYSEIVERCGLPGPKTAEETAGAEPKRDGKLPFSIEGGQLHVTLPPISASVWREKSRS